MKPRSFALMGHDVAAAGRGGSSTAEAGISVEVDAVLRTLEALRERGLRFVPWREFVARRNRDPVGLLTFDDGFAGLHHELAPRLARNGVPALVFLVTSSYEMERDPFPFWLFALRDAWPGLAVEARHAAESVPAMQRVLEAEQTQLPALLARPLAEGVAVFSARLDHRERNALGTQLNALGFLPRLTLSREQIEDMRGADGIEFGAHSVNHPPFSRLPNAEVEREILGSCRSLATLLGCAVEDVPFAYPFGDATPHAAEVVRRRCPAGFVTGERAVTPLDPVSLIPRITLDADTLRRIDAASLTADAFQSVSERAKLHARPWVRWLRGRPSPEERA
jgi:peptidoglycan/xylan/chitin deacetylase (PgdA/CDA1 family)